MRIVVLDDVTLDEDQLQRLRSAGELTLYQGTPVNRDEILNRARGAGVLISGWTDYPEGIFDQLPDLRLISLWSTGTDCVDLSSAQKAGIRITNVPGYASNPVAELTFGLMLAVLRKIPLALQEARTSRCQNWQMFEGRELAGKTIGILGTGAIGRKVARIARGFDMHVIAFDAHPQKALEADGILEYVAFEDVFQESDIVTLHIPLVEQTRGMINYQALARMQPHGILINTARAGLVDQRALVLCLEEGLLAGAGLDDVDLEHPSWELLSLMDQVVITPHIGFFTREAIQQKNRQCVNSVIDFIDGQDA
jgi:phosphoglycerate dehydrogenase-like enzyme